MCPDPIVSNDEAKELLGEREPLKPSEILKVLRYLKRNNEDLEAKVRMLKGEVGRASRRQ